MGFDIDFGALQQANPFAAYTQGQEVAKKRAQDQARREAGNVFATDPDKAGQILMGVGDYEGGLAMRKYGKEDRQEKASAAAVAKFAAGDAAGAQADLIAARDFDTASALAKMTTEQRAVAKANNEDLGGYAQTLLSQIQSGAMTPQDAKSHILQDKAHLTQLGLKPEQIDAFEPTPQNLQMLVSQGMDLKAALEQADRDRTFGLRKDQASEARRHNQAAESTSRAQVGVAQGNLGVARGRLGLSREQHQARLKAGGYGTPGVGMAAIPDNDVEVDQ